EVFPVKYLTQLMTELPHASYLNWYGPTETNVCTSFEVPAAGGGPGRTAATPLGPNALGPAPVGPGPIASACANQKESAVTVDGRRVARPGEEGELYVRGPGLMAGYWGNAGKTREVLVRNPFQEAYDEPAYRTGALVTQDPDGNYVFLGRRDGMVKT